MPIFSATKNKTAKTEKIGNKVVESQTSLKRYPLTSKLASTDVSKLNAIARGLAVEKV